METIRVFIADDHEIVREGLRLILEAGEGFALAGEAADGAEAVRLICELRPDVVLMDLRMPVMDGLAAVATLRKACPEVAVVILTTYNEDNLMVQGLQAGARGYLLKDTSRQILFDTIRAAARGETLLRPEVLEKLLLRAGYSQGGRTGAESPLEPTEREREILTAVAEGQRNKEIAFRLGITERTVKAHLSSIYNKLGVDSRAAAISAALQKGWLKTREET